jgi:hypothetical protein
LNIVQTLTPWIHPDLLQASLDFDSLLFSRS